MSNVEIETPRRFGPYVIVRMLDNGGQGRVDLALMDDAGRERLCVIKRMLPELADPNARARFDHELRITRRLSHGAVVRTVAVDEIEGEPCIVQEYVEGHSLAYIMSVCGTQHEPIPVPLALHVVREVVRALEYVHDFEDLGLVHRDISPANIQLGFGGEVKLLDFGVAKSEEQDFMTATGQLVGRPAFVAPEVYAGLRADRRADIYSTGVVLWGLLARRFVGDVRDAKGGLPKPSTLNPEVPAALDDVVARALAGKPDQRYQSAAAFRAALEGLVPRRFDGAAAVRDLLGSLFDVEAERRMRGLDLGEARRLLPQVAPEAEPAQPASRRRRMGIALVGTAAVIAALGVVGYQRARARTGYVGEAVAVASTPPSRAVGPVRHPAPTPDPPSAPAPAVTPPPAPAADQPAALAPAPRTRSAAAGRSARELTDQAEARLGEERFDEAIKLARAAVKAGAGADARILLARALLERGHTSEAERELVTATRMEPDNTAAAKFLRDVRAGNGEKR